MNLQAMLAGMARDGGGQVSFEEVAELQKALTSSYATDVATLTGGGALRIQSLDSTLFATIQENKHFRLFNALQKSNATATVDEWTEQDSVGGFLGGSTNSELGNIPAASGNYLRRVGLVKFLMTRREVSFVKTIENSIIEAETVEQMSGAKQLLTDAEFLSFEGNSAVVPTQFDGIESQIKQYAPADHVIDMMAQPLNDVTQINNAASLISAYGNFGTPTDIFVSQTTQSDFDSHLDPAFRVPLTSVPDGGIKIGSPVRGIRTSWGDIANQPDVFLRDQVLKMPFEVVQNGQFAAIAAANNFQPTYTAVASAGAVAGSQFAAAQGGGYYYGIAGVNQLGESLNLVSAEVMVPAGGSATLTITPSQTGQETGYVIYRSRLVSTGGTAALTDLREMTRIPKAAAGNTVYVDLNTDVPGTVKAFILNMTTGDKAITWRQFLPMLKFPLYPTVTATVPWAQLLFGYLRLGKVKHHVMFKNILPTTAVWRPFG